MPGQIYRLRSLLQALALYIEARGRLVQIELREAAGGSVGILVLAVLMLGAVLFAWLLALPALIWLLAKSQGWPWAYVTLGVAGVHVVLAFIFFLVLKSRLRRLKAFEETCNQFKRDSAWFKSNADSD
ncbi:MAG TPA: phage holin family protein [Prosthecobacter sp.]|nr:phage holin family protein [Prosthecobacter sp.]